MSLFEHVAVSAGVVAVWVAVRVLLDRRHARRIAAVHAEAEARVIDQVSRLVLVREPGGNFLVVSASRARGPVITSRGGSA